MLAVGVSDRTLTIIIMGVVTNIKLQHDESWYYELLQINMTSKDICMNVIYIYIYEFRYTSLANVIIIKLFAIIPVFFFL